MKASKAHAGATAGALVALIMAVLGDVTFASMLTVDLVQMALGALIGWVTVYFAPANK